MTTRRLPLAVGMVGMAGMAGIAAVALLGVACHTPGTGKVATKPPVTPPPVVATVPTVTPPCEPVGPPAPPPDLRAPDLVRGDEAYERGDLVAAAAAYDAFLARNSSPGEESARVLARMVVLCSLPSTRDPVAAQDYRKRLVDTFPTSPYRAEADLVLAANAEAESQKRRIQELEKELTRLRQVVEKLKEIDLAPPPRRPSPP